MRRTPFTLCAALLLLAACDESPSALAPCDYDQVWPQSSAVASPFTASHLASFLSDTAESRHDVYNEQDLLDGLKAGWNNFELKHAIVITKPIVLDDYPIGSFFSIRGMGGYGTQIVRGFDGPAPLISAKHTRDWAFRFQNVAFEAAARAYPNGGPSLDLDYVQASLFEDVMFEYHPHRPFVIHNASATTFRGLLLQTNLESALITNSSGGLVVDGGLIEDHETFKTGIEIHATPRTAQNTYPGPIEIRNVHQEYSSIRIVGFNNVKFSSWYLYFSRVDFDDVREPFSLNTEGVWAKSGAYRDGKLLFPRAECAS